MLCICLDAFKPDYYRYAPFLNGLRKENLSGELETVFGYTGIGASFFTGLYPNKHGIFSMFNYSRKGSIPDYRFFGSALSNVILNIGNLIRNEWFFYQTYNIHPSMLRFFSTSMKKTFPQKGSLRVKTLFDILEADGKSFSFIDFPSHFKNRKGSVMFSSSYKGIRDRVMKDKSEFCFAHFTDIDPISHEHGTKSKETKEVVKIMDETVEKISETGRKMLIWSDHGMVDVKNHIDGMEYLGQSGLTEGRDYVYFIDSTMLRVWTKSPTVKKRLISSLKNSKHGHILSASEVKNYKMPDGYGDIIWLANPGTLLLPNFFQGNHLMKAAHGYNPKIKAQKGIYIAPGGNGKRDANIVDMLPTILSSLKLPKGKFDGRSVLR